MTKASKQWKWRMLQGIRLNSYKRRLLKSCGPLEFDIAECLKFDSALCFRIFQDNTFNLTLTVVKAYNRVTKKIKTLKCIIEFSIQAIV